MEAIIEMCINEDGAKEDNLQSKKEPSSSKDDKRDFKNKWEDSFDLKSLDKTDFNKYDTIIYKKYRLPLAHPTNENLKDDPFHNIDLPEVLKGFEFGWKAFAAISAAIGKPHDVNSWETICQTHQLQEYQST
jgi:hypothetical protein